MNIFFHNNFLNKLNKCEINKIENNYPKISIVMPSYNQAEFIEKSILSVLNQDYKNIELIIIDGGSNDGTIEIIKKYQDYIFFWVSEKDKGQSDALNKGFKLASGEIYGWLNSDDIYLPNAFHNLMLAFKNNSSSPAPPFISPERAALLRSCSVRRSSPPARSMS